MKLKSIIEDTNTPAGRRFDLCIQAIIVASLLSFSIETLPNISESSRKFLNYTEILCVLIFTGEYLLRIIVADSKLRFIFSFFGLIDLAAILPFYLSTGLDLRTVRAVRLLRLFRIFKILRYSRAIRRFRRAFVIAREELVLFFSATAVLLYLTGVGIYFFENSTQPDVFRSVFDGFWWALATLTTVGYGDVYPITAGGKIFTFVVLMIGLGIVAVPTGLVASALSRARAEEETEERLD